MRYVLEIGFNMLCKLVWRFVSVSIYHEPKNQRPLDIVFRPYNLVYEYLIFPKGRYRDTQVTGLRRSARQSLSVKYWYSFLDYVGQLGIRSMSNTGIQLFQSDWKPT